MKGQFARILATFWAVYGIFFSPMAFGEGIFEQAQSAVNATLRENLHSRDLWFKHRHAVPGPKFPAVYLWDSAFIAEVWRVQDVAVAQDVLLSVLEHQHSDGMIPHEYSIFGGSSRTQPPLLSWVADRIYRTGKSKAFLAEAYPGLKAYHDWLMLNRRLPNGLFFWKDPYESGMDNSPRFSSRDEGQAADTTRIAAVDFSAYMVVEARSLAELASDLGMGSDALELEKTASEIAQDMNALLWDSATGYYYDLDLGTGKLIAVRSIASLTPLFAAVPSAAQAEQIVAHIRNPSEFNTSIPFPTVARDDSQFEKDCWRGPVWINMAYLTLEGMKNPVYGGKYDELAAAMSARLVRGVFQTYANTHKLVEFYDPDRTDFKKLTRKSGNWFKQLTLGNKPVDHFVGWTGLVNNLADECKPGCMGFDGN